MTETVRVQLETALPHLAETHLPLPALAQSNSLSYMTAFSPRYLMALWLLIGFAAPVAATPTFEQEQEIRTRFVTPHTLWAKPYAGGMTRVLFFSGLVLVGVKQRGRLDPPLENDPDRVALDEPLMLDAPVARRVEAGDPEAELFALQQGRAGVGERAGVGGIAQTLSRLTDGRAGVFLLGSRLNDRARGGDVDRLRVQEIENERDDD